MARAVEEWVGRSDDTPVPPRVKLRIVARQGNGCAECRAQFGARLKPEFDHRPALINGGENRESMIRALCNSCHGTQTVIDVAEKARTNRIKAKHLGIRKQSRLRSRNTFRSYVSNTKQVNE